MFINKPIKLRPQNIHGLFGGAVQQRTPVMNTEHMNYTLQYTPIIQL